MYSFVIYYNSKDGEEIAVASPSEIEKVEPTAEAEMQKPGGNAGGAGVRERHSPKKIWIRRSRFRRRKIVKQMSLLGIKIQKRK